MKVIVIGAGVVGANVAWRLVQNGAKVTVVEAGRPGSETSGNSFARVNAHRKPPRTYHELNVLGMKAHRNLCHEFPDQNWWGGSGCLEWSHAGESTAAFRTRVAAFHEWNYKAEIVDRRRLAAIAPDIDATVFPDHEVAFFEDEGWISPVPMIHHLLQAAQRRGAVVLTMAGPARLAISGDVVTGVKTAGGDLEADAVVNCAGWQVNSVLDDKALHLPMEPTLGLLAITPPVTADLGVIVLGPRCDIRPDGSGRLMLHGTEIDHRLAPAMDHKKTLDLGAELVAHARKLLPSMGEVPVEAVRIGTRARPSDGLPAVGALPGLANYTVVATHSGVTLSPWLGHAVADEVFKGRIHDELAEFRPARFFGDVRPPSQPWVQD